MPNGDSVSGALTVLPTTAAYDVEKQILETMLRDPQYSWRSFLELCRKADLPADMTAKLLIELGARPNRGSRNVWGLVERVGNGIKPMIPDTVEDDGDTSTMTHGYPGDIGFGNYDDEV